MKEEPNKEALGATFGKITKSFKRIARTSTVPSQPRNPKDPQSHFLVMSPEASPYPVRLLLSPTMSVHRVKGTILASCLFEDATPQTKREVVLFLKRATKPQEEEEKLEDLQDLSDYNIAPDDIIVARIVHSKITEQNENLESVEQFKMKIKNIAENVENHKQDNPETKLLIYEESFQKLMDTAMEFVSFLEKVDTEVMSPRKNSLVPLKNTTTPTLLRHQFPVSKSTSSPHLRIPLRTKEFTQTLAPSDSDTPPPGEEWTDRKVWVGSKGKSLDSPYKPTSQNTPVISGPSPGGGSGSDVFGDMDSGAGMDFFSDLEGDSNSSMLKIKGSNPKPNSYLSSQRNLSKVLPEKKNSKKKAAVVVETNLLKPIRLNESGKSSMSLSPVVSQTQIPGLNIESYSPNLDLCKSLEFEYIHDVYKLHFAGNAHINWIGTDEKGRPDDYFIISIKETPENNSYRGLINSKYGWDDFTVPEDAIPRKEMKRLALNLEKWLRTENPTCYYARLKGVNITNEIKNIENNHRQVVKFMAVSVIYCKNEQTDPLEMFGNNEPSDRFLHFLKVMNVPINYSSGTTNTSYWRNNDVTWHVAPHMIPEEHRRLIGNTQCTLFFKEPGEPDVPFDPVHVNNLGPVPQFFIVVTYLEDKWKVGFFSRQSVKPFGPQLPADYLFDDSNIQDYLLTKVHNGYMKTRACPPINKLHEEPRKVAIKEFAEKHVPEKWFERKKAAQKT